MISESMCSPDDRVQRAYERERYLPKPEIDCRMCQRESSTQKRCRERKKSERGREIKASERGREKEGVRKKESEREK